MPTINTTFDAFSPLIVFTPAGSWGQGNLTLDPEGVKYQDRTFILTTGVNSSASFSFNGTSIWLFGAKRGNHGNYAVTLDGVTQTFNGNAAGDGIFQTVLFSASDLTLEIHTASIQNIPSSSSDIFTDIDFITIETVIGDDTSEQTISATTSLVSMSSELIKVVGSGWQSADGNPAFQAPDGLYTSTPGDTLSYAFEINYNTGDTVTVFGEVGPLCGQYNVSLDGAMPTTYNASGLIAGADQVLYFVNGLGGGSHNLLFTNLPPQPDADTVFGNSLLIQQFTNQSFASGPLTSKDTNNTAGTNSTQQQKKPSSSLTPGLASGLISAAVVFAVVVSLFILYRRRRRRSEGMVRIGSGALESGQTTFDIDGESPTFPKLNPVKPRSNWIAPSTISTPSSTSIWSTVSAWSTRTRKKRDSSSFYITAWNPRAAVHVVQLPAIPNSESTPVNSITETRPDGESERSRRRQRRKERRTRSGRPEQPETDDPLNAQLGTVGGTDEGPSSSSPPTSRRRRRKHRERRERDAESSGKDQGRLRSFRNSRIMRAARTLHLAKPGSSTNGSTYAPTVSGLTSEISERPTMTLSPISEAPPLPTSTPSFPRTLLIANQS